VSNVKNTDKNGRNRQPNQEARELLQAPDYFCRVLRAVQRGGVVEEQLNALALHVVALSALGSRPINAIVKGASSAGKNFLVSRGLRLLPEDAVREISSSSKTAWNYSQDDFRNRIVYLQERNDAAGAVHPVRLLISEGKLVRIVTSYEGGVRIQKPFVAEGPIASISTTTRDRIEIDDETRHFSLWLDETSEQTRRVNRAYVSNQTHLTAGEIDVWHRAHGLIKDRAQLPIVLPDWFLTVADGVDTGKVASRRHFPAFVEGCKTIALVRSFQRDSTDLPNQIEVSFVDFCIAEILFEEILVESLYRYADEGRNTRSAVRKACATKGGPINAVDFAKYLSISEDRAYSQFRDGKENGEVRQSNEPGKGNAKFYLPAEPPRFLPDPRDLLRNIPQISTPVEFIHPVTGKEVRLEKQKASQ
jgi:hypothetical protein